MKTATRSREKLKTIRRPRAPRVNIEGMARYFAGQPEVVVAYLFGSVARGRGDHFSDVDVAVLFDAGVDRSQRGELLLQYIVDLAGFADREVDVVNLDNASPVLKMQVLREGRVLYARTPEERIAFEVRAAKLYYDTQPLRDFQRKVLFAESRVHGRR